MNTKAILIVAGEPYSVFSEILFKSLNKIDSKRPIVLIASKKLFEKQMKKLGYNFNFREIDKNLSKVIENKKKIINIINVDFNNVKIFDKISDKSNKYIKESFKIANNRPNDQKSVLIPKLLKRSIVNDVTLLGSSKVGSRR